MSHTEGMTHIVDAKRPSKPSHLFETMEACLQALVEHGLGDKISLGGRVGLLHYLDYRSTHDIDAWWVDSATTMERKQIVQVIETTLESFGQVKTRAWGDVVSIESQVAGRTVFSFQIARRSAQLEPAELAPWTDVLLDNFSDLVAAKMVALVERGAPRDFRDVYALCQAGLTTPEACWQLWQRRQQLAESDVNYVRAELAVETHLARVEQHRPLAQIVDRKQQDEAEKVRAWFRKEFLHVPRLRS